MKKHIFFLLDKVMKVQETVGHSKIPVNKNPYHRNKLIDLQCKSTDWFLYDTSFYRQGCSDCKIYSNNVKQRSSKPIFSWKHSLTNEYIAINKFFEKNWVCYLLPEKTFPSCRKNFRSLSRSSLSFSFVPLVPVASFFVMLVLFSMYFYPLSLKSQ